MAPISTGLGEIFQYTLEIKPGFKDKYTIMDLRTYQDWIVRRQMLGTPVPVPFLEKLNPGFFSALFLPTRLLLLAAQVLSSKVCAHSPQELSATNPCFQSILSFLESYTWREMCLHG